MTSCAFTRGESNSGRESDFGTTPVWKFFLVAEEDNVIAICTACSEMIPRVGKNASSFNTTNLISHLKGRHRGETVLRDFKQPPLLER